MNTNTIDETVEFFGKDFKVSEVTNPHLKRVIADRQRLSEYGDHSRTDPGYDNEWNQHSEYNDYRVKYHEHRYGNYAEKH